MGQNSLNWYMSEVVFCAAIWKIQWLPYRTTTDKWQHSELKTVGLIFFLFMGKRSSWFPAKRKRQESESVIHYGPAIE